LKPKRCGYDSYGIEEAPLVKLFGACLLLLVTFTPLPAAAHVAFVSPTNRATLVVGEPVKIAWADTVLHEGVGYDLDYAGNLLGQGLSTRTHSFEWVPAAGGVRQRMMRR
jgi:hypothetical protein